LCIPHSISLYLARFINNRFPFSIVIFSSNSTYGRCENNPFHRIGFQAGFEKVYGSFDCRVNYISLNKVLCKFNTEMKYEKSVSYQCTDNVKKFNVYVKFFDDYQCIALPMFSFSLTLNCIEAATWNTPSHPFTASSKLPSSFKSARKNLNWSPPFHNDRRCNDFSVTLEQTKMNLIHK